MKLYTEVNLPVVDRIFDFDSTLCSIGSCFSANFSEHLSQLAMDVSNNPSGIIYNPQSIQQIIDRVVDNRLFQVEDFFEHQGLWKSWGHHGSFNQKTVLDIITKTNEALKFFRDKLASCDLFLITPSSSVVYRHPSVDYAVANCHRVPNKEFSKVLLTVEENRAALVGVVNSIRKLNPNVKIIFTLSPVRHYPGELTLNSISKANLLSAIHTVANDESCDYFPSYEIMLDELRDYRFYKDDLLHPTELAKKIIYKKFITTYFSKEAQAQYPKRIKNMKFDNHRNRE